MEMHEILKLSVTEHASDLHMLPGLAPMFRIHGDLMPAKDLPINLPEENKRLIYSVMSKEQQQIFETQLVIDMSIVQPGIGNFRVSVLHQLNGVAAVFRIIPEVVPTFEELDLPNVLKTLLVLTNGIILIAGATGSGKSSSIAAMLDFINTNRACNIITIEDPIEFIHKSKRSVFNQLQVGRDTTDFAAALRGSLRQDPNVILIGELRDLETIRLALVAAETGHLVLATLHASSSAIAISRVVDVFPTEEKNRVRSMLSETLQAIICQTLVKKATGGRVGAFEIMIATPAIRHLIRQDMGSHIENTMQTSGDIGMCTLEQYLHKLVERRLINPSVERAVLTSRGSFKDSADNLTKKK